LNTVLQCAVLNYMFADLKKIFKAALSKSEVPYD
jgi:hypothetical protein